MKTWIKIGIPVLVIVFIAFFFRGRMAVSVLVAPANRGTAVNAVTGTIKVLAAMDISVKAQSRGQLLENIVMPGQHVLTGDVIGVQDSEELRLRIKDVEIRLEASRAKTTLESIHAIDLERIEKELEGVKLSVDLKQAPLSRLEETQRQRRKSEVYRDLEKITLTENLGLLENQLTQLKLQLDRLTTRAPFDGVVAEISAWTGDLVNANQALIRLVSKGRVVMMELTEEDYFGVKDKQPITLRLASYPDRTFEGIVSRMEDIANSNNKTRNVFVTVDAPDDVMVPGLTGEGYLVKNERTNVVLIPRRALIGNLVYLVVDGKIEVRRVAPGFLGLQLAEVLEGIEEGEMVVMEDQNLLKPGDRVKTVLKP